MPMENSLGPAKKNPGFDDKVRFLRSWFEKPLLIGAVMPSGKALARKMAGYVDVNAAGPVIELGPGTGPVTEALIGRGVDPARLILVEFDPGFCDLLRARFPKVTVVQGDAYSLRRTLAETLKEPASALVSSLPLMTKPVKTRLQLVSEAFTLMKPNSPFIQFTYAAVSPVPTDLEGLSVDSSERIWLNVPPARVWVYRRG